MRPMLRVTIKDTRRNPRAIGALRKCRCFFSCLGVFLTIAMSSQLDPTLIVIGKKEGAKNVFCGRRINYRCKLGAS